jgi:hypothetical protein
MLPTISTAAPDETHHVIFGQGTRIIESIDGLAVTIFEEYFIKNLGHPDILKSDPRFKLNWPTYPIGDKPAPQVSAEVATLFPQDGLAAFSGRYVYCGMNRCPTAEEGFIAGSTLDFNPAKLCINYLYITDRLRQRYQDEFFIFVPGPAAVGFVVGYVNGHQIRVMASQAWSKEECVGRIGFLLFRNSDVEIK